ncbi:helix-turn-helix domain-containing protein [Cupriavidus malaysiensis]|uniref:helix-turn-helix domain-containing protein n=1 Tax=Cupriavidus malaysiensis TaxID=367825 RepID=UPI000A041DB3
MNGLTELRKKLGLSQAKLGAAIGIGQSAISQCERGLCLMSIGQALRLVDFAKSRGVEATLDQIYLELPGQRGGWRQDASDDTQPPNGTHQEEGK